MIRYFRELRLLPIAMVASACLLALVAADLLLGRNTASTSDRDSLEHLRGDRRSRRAGRGAARRPETVLGAADVQLPRSERRAAGTGDLGFLPAIPPLAGDKNNADIITGSVTEPGAEKSDKPKGEGSAAAGKDAGKDAAGKDAAGKEAAGKTAAGKDAKKSRRTRRRRPMAR